MPIGKKQARSLLAELKEARRAATLEGASFERASFDFTGETVRTNGSFAGDEDGAETPTNYIKRKTRIYRQSWIIEPLDRVIEELERVAK